MISCLSPLTSVQFYSSIKFHLELREEVSSTEQKRQIELTKGQAQKWHFGRELRRQQLRLINYLLKELSFSHVEMYDFFSRVVVATLNS